MTRPRSGRVLALAAALAAAAILGGCQGAILTSDPADLLTLAPDGVASKVVTVEVVCSRGRLTVDQASVAAIERMPGVFAVRRGSERNVVHVLVDDFVRPESIGERLEPECRGKVLGVVRPGTK